MKPPCPPRLRGGEAPRPLDALSAVLVALTLFATGCKDAPGSPALNGTAEPHPSGSAQHPSAPPETPPRPANPAEMAILAPLAAGTKLGDFEVVEVHGVDHGGIDVLCKKGSARIVLTVALLVQGGPSPPASTDRYAVFYSLRGADPADGEHVAKALASLLEANKTVPPPPGLGPFVPRPISL